MLFLWVRAFRLVRWSASTLVLAALIASVVVSPAASGPHPPAAEPPAAAALLERCQRLEGLGRWDEALGLWKELARTTASRTSQTSLGQLTPATIDRRLRTCRSHAALARRYTDPEFRRFARKPDSDNGRSVLVRTYSLIGRHYYRQTTPAGLIDAGVRHLRLALDNATFLKAHRLSLGSPRVARAQAELGRLSQRARPVESPDRMADEVFRLARALYRASGLAPATVAVEFAWAACESLDRHSRFLLPDVLGDSLAMIDGQFVGIGIELKERTSDARQASRAIGSSTHHPKTPDFRPPTPDPSLRIVRPLPGSPAAQAGIRPGDWLVGIDGFDARGWSLERAACRLRGPIGSPVRLALRRDGAERPVSVRLCRAVVRLQCIRTATLIDRRHRIGYVHLVSFQNDTSVEMAAAVDALAAEGMTAMVLDLRGNPGGLFGAAVDVADLFIDEGVLVSTRRRDSREPRTYRARRRQTRRDLPLVVLVDGDTASAGEILAAALRDHRRARLVGQRTYGKGSVQTLFELGPSHAGLRLTTAIYYAPNGQSLEGRGIQPDVAIRLAPDARIGYMSRSSADARACDTQLVGALALARRQLVRGSHRP